MKKRDKKVLFYVFSFLVLLMSGIGIKVNEVLATENAVQTNGEITFYEETTSSSTTEPSKSSSELPKTSGSDSSVVIKPVGKLPSTGELVRMSLWICGIVILFFFLIFYFVKKKKKSDEGEC